MDLQSNAYQRATGVFERLGDPELLDAYKRYVARLEATLGPAWLDTYASMYQRDRRQLTGQDGGSPTLPEELTLRERALADPEVTGLHDKVIAHLRSSRILDERYVD